MSSRCDFLLKFFGDRFILLKEDWLIACVDYLNDQIPTARSFSDEKFANLVFDQWTCSNIESTSFPTFGNHGIDENTKKFSLQGSIVCQVNSFIDTGSPYYAQFTSLNEKSRVDRTGFEKVFHEKEDDYDKKPSRLLKLALTDGESSLKAIEFWKCPQLSLYCKPGVKLLIQGPCLIRKGTFLLKPNNCKILGGQVLPLLNCRRPLDQYARMLKIKNFKSSDQSDKENQCLSAQNQSLSHPQEKPAPAIRPTPFSPTFPKNSPGIRAPPGPTPLLAKYLNKPSVSTPSTSAPREISPDPMADSDDDWENPNFFSDERNRQSTPIRPAEVTVRSLLSRNTREMEDFGTRSPVKRKSIQTPPTVQQPSRLSGLLTSRQIDPEDEILENMIEKDEEPVKSPKKAPKPTVNPFRRQSPPKTAAKRIKVEADSDDDIQIIEITPPAKKVKEKRKIEEKEEKMKVEEEANPLDPEEKEALEAFSRLKLSSFAESTRRIKYSVGSRRFQILAIIEEILEPLRVVDEMWTMKVEMVDDSGTEVALIDNNTLVNLIGYTCEEAIAIRNSSDLEKRLDGKHRLAAVKEQLNRLDLVFEIEFFAGSTSSCPVIRSIKTLAEQIDVY